MKLDEELENWLKKSAKSVNSAEVALAFINHPTVHGADIKIRRIPGPARKRWRRADGVLRPDEEILILNTGSGLKYLELL